MAELTRLGKYELAGEPIQGGMGAVHRGIDPMLDRQVAVKVLHRHLTSQRGFRDRFLREAKILARLKHKNITQVYDAGESEEGLYLAMEFVEGITLEDAMFRGMYRSPKSVLPIIKQACEALDYAHSQGVIHRDIKPSNIMVKPNGEVMLMDFGIARLDGQSAMTQDGQTIGTPHYMSPEQCKGVHVDSRSDIYSLAVVVYEMLSGIRPFEGENLLSIINRQIKDTPAPISAHIAGIPSPMVRAISRALRKEPSARPQTAMQFYAELAGAGPPPPPGPVSGGHVAPHPNAAKRKTLIVIAGSLAIGLIGLVIFLAISGTEKGGGGGGGTETNLLALTNITVANGATETATPSVNVKLSVLGEPTTISLSETGTADGPWVDFVPETTYTFSSSEGEKTLYVTVKDGVGNTATGQAQIELVKPVGPTADELVSEAGRLIAALDYIGARKKCSQALGLDAKHYEALIAMCMTYMMEGKTYSSKDKYQIAATYYWKAKAVAFPGDLPPDQVEQRRTELADYRRMLESKGAIP